MKDHQANIDFLNKEANCRDVEVSTESGDAWRAMAADYAALLARNIVLENGIKDAIEVSAEIGDYEAIGIIEKLLPNA